MPLFEMINTEMQLASPLDNSLETAFGRAALELLRKGDARSQKKLLELYGQAQGLVKELDKLLKSK